MKNREEQEKIYIFSENKSRYVAHRYTETAQILLSPQGLRLLSTKSEIQASEIVHIENWQRTFWKEHIKRLQIQCESKDLRPVEADELEELYHMLTKAQEIEEGFLRIVVTEDNVFMHYYPGDHLAVFASAEREEKVSFPDKENLDVTTSQDVYELTQNVLHCRCLYFPRDSYWEVEEQEKLALETQKAREEGKELLLIDEEGYLYKGTRSNVYWLDDEDRLYTSFADDATTDITRKCVFEAARKLQLQVFEEALRFEDLRSNHIESAFEASSLFDLLPIASIQKEDGNLLEFNTTHPILYKLAEMYQVVMEEFKEDK